MKLNLGGNETKDGGPNSPDLVGFINVDLRPGEGVDEVADIRVGLDWIPVGTVEEIRASHVIEHMTYVDALKAVKYWSGLLKAGGLMRIYCPDGGKLSLQYIGGMISCEAFSRLLLGDQDYDLNIHREIYDRGRLNRLVENAGLEIIGQDPRPNAYEFDLGVQARKTK